MLRQILKKPIAYFYVALQSTYRGKGPATPAITLIPYRRTASALLAPVEMAGEPQDRVCGALGRTRNTRFRFGCRCCGWSFVRRKRTYAPDLDGESRCCSSRHDVFFPGAAIDQVERSLFGVKRFKSQYLFTGGTKQARFTRELALPLLAQDRFIQPFRVPYIAGGWIAVQSDDQDLAFLELDPLTIVFGIQNDRVRQGGIRWRCGGRIREQIADQQHCTNGSQTQEFIEVRSLEIHQAGTSVSSLTFLCMSTTEGHE